MKKTGVAIIHGMGNQNRDISSLKKLRLLMKIQMKGSTDLLIFISNRFTGLVY
ncbi:MAG: hypothetical protein WAU38_13080 [Ignavibacteria bacterium]